MEAIKTSVTNSPVEGEVKGKAIKKSGKRIGYNYIILRSLKRSHKNDVVTCLYIKSLTNFGICVIKEGTYGDTKDKQGRDIKDRLMWQRELHEQLQDKIRLPRLLGSFEENGNYYLVLERIRGKSLGKACKDVGKDLREGLITGNKLGMKFLDYMLQMIELLDTLHKQQVIHRDVTAANFMITPAGKVAVIDMELSYSLVKHFPDPPFQLGTHGYMSPEQEATAMPAVEQDVFSVGAIIIQIWTGILPIKITNVPFNELTEKIQFFIPDKVFSEIVIQSLNPEPLYRPSLYTMYNVISEYSVSLKNKTKRPLSVVKKYSSDEILETIQQAIRTLASPLMVDEEKGWFSNNRSVSQNADKNKINRAWYASFHKGAFGVIYLLSKANMLGLDIEASRPFIEKGIQLIEPKYLERMQEANPGLHFGGSGIAAVLATSLREGLIEPQTAYYNWINKLLEMENQALGFQYGIAGQGIANWLCHPFLNPEKVNSRLKEYTDLLLNLQEKDGSWVRSVKKGKKRITRGFAHGVAGIAYFLLTYGEFYNDNEVKAAASRGLHWLMKKSIRSKNKIQWQSASGTEIAPWWCEGVAGIALTFAKAYSSLGDSKYREIAVGALYNHNKKIVYNNLSQCHGLSGLGEIYLEVFRNLGSEEWFERADWILQTIMHLKKQHVTHGPYWLVEYERIPVADFMTGNSGIIYYLLRYCYPEKIGFPLLS